MKIIDREPIGRKRFVKIQAIVAAKYPPRRAKQTVDIIALAEALGYEYGNTYANWMRGQGMPKCFAREIETLLNIQ